MTIQEQASLDALRTEIGGRFDKLDLLMEARRLEEVRVQEQLDTRLRTVERIAYAAGVLGTSGLAFAVALVYHIAT